MKDIDRDDQPARPSRPLLKGLLLGFSVVVLLAIGLLAARHYLGAADTGSPGASDERTAGIGGPFTLTDQHGRTVTDRDFLGHWLLVYFGYTYCPDICPTSLARNGEAIELLGEKGGKVLPVLITIDPERDTPQKLKDYVQSFHPRTVGLTGTPEQIAAVARAYRVYYAQAHPSQGEGNNYLMDHSSLTYLIGPDGRLVEFFSQNVSPQQVADFLSKRL